MRDTTSHLSEERLFDRYMASRSGDPVDRPATDHLRDCPACAARYIELSQFMDDLRTVGDADADAAFPADRLRAQHQEIARRIELLGRSARVISFPHPTSTRQLRTRRRRALPPWVAATAAAGLVAGVAAGMFLERAGRAPAPPLSASVLAGRSFVATPAVEPPAAGREAVQQELFMSEIDLAADSPRTEELAAYDELTPHIREVSFVPPGR